MVRCKRAVCVLCLWRWLRVCGILCAAGLAVHCLRCARIAEPGCPTYCASRIATSMASFDMHIGSWPSYPSAFLIPRAVHLSQPAISHFVALPSHPLPVELDQMSESSAAAAGDALYHQLQQYDSLGGEPGFSSHARHASIDMGLLNRQLHGGASRSSASSSQQRARSKQQQRRQGSSGAAQPLLLHEAVTSGEHWRSSSSGQLLLPPGVPGSAPVGKEERQQQDSQQPAGQQQQPQQQEQQQQEQPEQQQQQRQGSPGGSEGGASYCSGEIVGSPGHPASGYPRSDSYAQRQAGTAQWVYDRANSVDAGEQDPDDFGGVCVIPRLYPVPYASQYARNATCWGATGTAAGSPNLAQADRCAQDEKCGPLVHTHTHLKLPYMACLQMRIAHCWGTWSDPALGRWAAAPPF